MLEYHPSETDLHIITGDSDYLSPLSRERLHEFLEAEWREQKSSAIHVYPNMSSFFSRHYPNIQLSEEVETQLAVERLVASGNFASTHAAVATLSEMTDFTDSQVQSLVEGALGNNQVRWILADDDVNAFFRRILRDFAEVLEPSQVAALEAQLDEEE